MTAEPAAQEPEPLEQAAQEPEPEVPEQEIAPVEPEPEVPEQEIAPVEPDPEPDPEPLPDPALAELASQIAELQAGLAAAQRRADELATVARRQSDMVDELHGENRRLREGEIREALAPLVRGVARLWDELSRMRAGEDTGDLQFLHNRVAEILHDGGVLPLEPALGAPFDPKEHQATGSATTDDAAKDRTVAEVRRAGLRRDDGRMLRAADVVVFRFVAPPEPPELAEDTAITEEVA